MAGEGWAIRMSSAGGFEARRGGNLRGGGQGSRQWRQRTKGEARRASGGWVHRGHHVVESARGYCACIPYGGLFLNLRVENRW